MTFERALEILEKELQMYRRTGHLETFYSLALEKAIEALRIIINKGV